MILFVVDQIAGAEYIFPLLSRWQKKGFDGWKVVCSAVSAEYLEKRSIDCLKLPSPDVSDVEKILDQYRPMKTVLSSSGVSALEDSFLTVLKKRRIPSYQFIDYWVNYALRFERKDEKGDIFRFYPDKILTIDSKARKEMISTGIPDDIIEVVGQPHFESCLRSLKNSDSGSCRAALLVTQPVSKYYGRSLGYDERMFVSCCLDVWKNLNKDWKRIGILVHPAECSEQYVDLASGYSNDIKVMKTDECDLAKYTLVIGMFSSFMIRSVLSGIATVAFQPDARGDDMNFLSRYGYIERFVASEDLYNFLREIEICGSDDSNRYGDIRQSLTGSCDRFENVIMSNFSMEDKNE